MASRVEAPAVTTITLTIDDQQVQVPQGTNIIEAARKIGVDIPYLCYHHQLTSFGGCRLCLVEIEKVPKLLAACNTTVAEGMVVRTTTEKVKSQRTGTLEFLLLNHPLDCPVCDKGGECELQDRVFEHGNGCSRMTEPKLHIEDYDLGPLIVRNQDRCIICKRCIKVMEEIAGEPVLEFGQRGVTTEIYTFEHESFKPGFSGNTIRVCPVGALMSKPFRFRARPWELIKTPSLCSLCSVGCNVRADVRENQLLRLVGLENKQVNDAWLCDRGQFGYDYINSDRRLLTPLVRRDGALQEASWAEAIQVIASRIRAMGDEAGSRFGAIGGARASNEDLFALRRFTLDVMKSNNLDHRAGGTGGGYLERRPRPGDIETLPGAQVVLLIGTDLTADAPVLDLVLKRSLLPQKMKLIVANPRRTALCKFTEHFIQYSPGEEPAVIEALGRAASGADVTETAGVSADLLKAAGATWAGAEIASIIYGTDLAEADGGGAIVDALAGFASSSGKSGHAGHVFLEAVRECNTWGARLLGVLPGGGSGEGRGTNEMLEALQQGEIETLIVSNANPAVEAGPGGQAKEALSAAPFLVVHDLFLTETAELADVVLPATPITETNATWTNVECRIQRAVRAMNARGGARELWAVLDDVASELGASIGMGSAAEATRQLREHLAALPQRTPGRAGEPAAAPPVPRAGGGLLLFSGAVMFGRDSLQRESRVLMDLSSDFFVEINSADARALGLEHAACVEVSTDHGALAAELRVTDDVPQGSAFVPAGYCEAPAAQLFSHGARVQACQVAAIPSAAAYPAPAPDGEPAL